MPRKKKDGLTNEQFIQAFITALKPKHRLKICCHRKDMPEMCEIIELPFQPRNGDIICVKPPNAPEEWNRLTIPISSLIYDATLDCWVMRPDILRHMQEQFKRETDLDQNIPSPLEQL